MSHSRFGRDAPHHSHHPHPTRHSPHDHNTPSSSIKRSGDPSPYHPFRILEIMEGMPKKLETKTLTGRYDMKQLIKVQQVEQWFTTQLVDLYKVQDEDALPISFDLLEVIEKPTEKRPAFLKEKLTACPSEAESVIKELLAKLDELNIEL